MEKYIFDQSNGLWYNLSGDYYLPCLTVPETAQAASVGRWGKKHLTYIQKHRRSFYTALLLSGKLNSHLADIDRQATEMMNRLIKEMAQVQGITEEMKANDQMAWVGAMNTIRSCATEIVTKELIFV